MSTEPKQKKSYTTPSTAMRMDYRAKANRKASFSKAAKASKVELAR